MFRVYTSVLLITVGLLTFEKAHSQVRCETLFVPTAVKPYEQGKSWGLQTFEREFDVLSNFFVSNRGLSDAEMTKAMMKADVRRSFFKLQALSRMLENQKPKFFAEQRVIFKALEDATGKLDLAASLRKTAAKLEEPTLLEHFAKREAEAQTEFIATMKNSGFWSAPEATATLFKKDFAKHGGWIEGKSEKKYFIEILEDYASNLHASVKKNEFDNADIEKGLHELRRRLRWVLMQVMALKGMVELRAEEDMTVGLHRYFLTSIMANPTLLQSKYTQVDQSLVSNPIRIPKKKLSLVTELVAKIGESKDAAEMQIYIREALVHLNASPAKIAEVMAKLDGILNSPEIDHQAMAREIQESLAETKLLKEYAESLEKLN